MELGHLARSAVDLDAGSDGLPVILSAVHDKLDARFGAKLLRRPSRRTRHGSVSDKENTRVAPAPTAPGPLPVCCSRVQMSTPLTGPSRIRCISDICSTLFKVIFYSVIATRM
jgi:hypothetical protein